MALLFGSAADGGGLMIRVYMDLLKVPINGAGEDCCRASTLFDI